MIDLVWWLELGSSLWWSGPHDQVSSGITGTAKPGLVPGIVPAAVAAPTTRLTLELRIADIGIFSGDPGALEAEVRWGHGSGALTGSPTLLASRFYGRLSRATLRDGAVFVELEHYLAALSRLPRRHWSPESQRSEHDGDAGFDGLRRLSKGEVQARWPRRS